MESTTQTTSEIRQGPISRTSSPRPRRCAGPSRAKGSAAAEPVTEPTPLSGTPLSRIEELDAQLAKVARNSAALRMQLGMCLLSLSKKGGHVEMGFPSLEAYALERCGRSARWVQQSRSLAARLEGRPRIRDALMRGEIGWSMATLIAPHASEEDELLWVDEAQRRTYRQMKRIVFGPKGVFHDETLEGFVDATPPDAVALTDAVMAEAVGDNRCRVLTITADREDMWLYDCAKMIASHLCKQQLIADDVVSALLAEGGTALWDAVPKNELGLHRVRVDEAQAEAESYERAQRAWEAQLQRWRDQAEALCEPKLRSRWEHAGSDEEICPSSAPRTSEKDVARWADSSLEEIDAESARIADELAQRDVTIGRLAETFWKLDGWRRLGYASAGQYARERLGTSLTSIKNKRKLARQLEAMPEFETAIGQRLVGYESARLLATVAVPETSRVWLKRAAERTVQHLREETQIAQLVARYREGALPTPPSEAAVARMKAVEGYVVSGMAFVPSGKDGMAFVPSGKDGAEDAAAPSDGTLLGQMSAPPPELGEPADPTRILENLLGRLDEPDAASRQTRTRCGGRVTLRVRVQEATYRHYRSLERLHRRVATTGEGFLRFLCTTFIKTWKDVLRPHVRYAAVYARDGYRCQNPVCGRRSVTPHHLRFRSAGGDDSEENLISLCWHCHLYGVHLGRLTARPPASRVEWTIGRVKHTRVVGRRRVAHPHVKSHS